MLRKLLAAFLLLGLSYGAANAQAVNISIANEGATGTTLNKLAKLTGAPSTAIIAATTDTQGVVGIVVGWTGSSATTGNAIIARQGIASCVFDGATTANDYVQISSSTAGDCHDAGATRPTTGQILGRVLITNGAGGTYAMTVSGPEIIAASVLNSAQTYTATQSVQPFALTDGSTIAVDCTKSNGFTLTLTGNTHTLGNPSPACPAGTTTNFAISTGTGFTGFATGTNYKYAGGTAPTWSTAASKKDILTCWWDTTGTGNCSALVDSH